MGNEVTGGVDILVNVPERSGNTLKRKTRAGALAFFGYILSPLSWWNDPFVNLPIAYVFAFPFGLISNSLFVPMMILGYWITNITGLILLHGGIRGLVRPNQDPYGRRELIRDVAISVVYSLGVIMLALAGWLASPKVMTG